LATQWLAVGDDILQVLDRRTCPGQGVVHEARGRSGCGHRDPGDARRMRRVLVDRGRAARRVQRQPAPSSSATLFARSNRSWPLRAFAI